MNTFWLKIAGVVVLVVVVIVAIATFTGKDEPKQQKTIYDQWEQDEKELTAEPQYKEPPTQKKMVEPAEPVARPEFKKLNPEEQVEAEQKWQWALNQRKMGRLPGVKLGYKNMVDTCREIIQRWPESEYAFYAKRALADLPERYKKMYNITKEEIDLGDVK